MLLPPLPPYFFRFHFVVGLADVQAKASRESAAGKSGALRALLEASAPGGALHGAGLCGRLGDLGAVSGEYDVAVRLLFRFASLYVFIYLLVVVVVVVAVVMVRVVACGVGGS